MKASSLIASAILAACTLRAPVTPAAPADVPPKPIPVYGVQVVRTTPHDINAFTEGFFFLNGYFYESTGLDGHSTVRKVKPETGQVLQRANLPPEMFGEGIAPWHGRLIGLPGKNPLGCVLD